jgi:Flp pilus assembly CpaE family ATPase
MTDIDCLRSAVRLYRAVERVRPHVPSRIRRAVNRFTPTERRAAARGLGLIDQAICRALSLPCGGR